MDKAQVFRVKLLRAIADYPGMQSDKLRIVLERRGSKSTSANGLRRILETLQFLRMEDLIDFDELLDGWIIRQKGRRHIDQASAGTRRQVASTGK